MTEQSTIFDNRLREDEYIIWRGEGSILLYRMMGCGVYIWGKFLLAIPIFTGILAIISLIDGIIHSNREYITNGISLLVVSPILFIALLRESKKEKYQAINTPNQYAVTNQRVLLCEDGHFKETPLILVQDAVKTPPEKGKVNINLYGKRSLMGQAPVLIVTIRNLSEKDAEIACDAIFEMRDLLLENHDPGESGIPEQIVGGTIFESHLRDDEYIIWLEELSELPVVIKFFANVIFAVTCITLVIVVPIQLFQVTGISETDFSNYMSIMGVVTGIALFVAFISFKVLNRAERYVITNQRVLINTKRGIKETSLILMQDAVKKKPKNGTVDINLYDSWSPTGQLPAPIVTLNNLSEDDAETAYELLVKARDLSFEERIDNMGLE